VTVFLGQGDGMVIGAIDGVVITAETPIDYSQWEDSKPWHPITLTRITD
jgi:hypothetical protein